MTRRIFLIVLGMALAWVAIPPNDSEAKTKNSSAEVAAGFAFPTGVGLFRRQGPVKFDEGGNPYGSYWAGGLVHADVFYYRTYGHSLQREYSDCKDYVKISSPKARLVSDSAITIYPRGDAHAGRRAVFTIQKGPLAAGGPAKSQLLVFQLGDRFVKYRITYPINHAQRAEEEIDRFLKALAWPGR